MNELNCPICYQTFGHAPGCPREAEEDDDEDKPATKEQLIVLRDALLRWKDKDAAAAADNLIDILNRRVVEEDLGTRCIISGGECLELSDPPADDHWYHDNPNY